MNLLRTLNRVASPAMAIRPLFDAACRNGVFVFNYHEVTDAPSRFSRDFNLNVRPATFSRQLAWIARSFNVITPAQLVGNEFDLPAALITFDDGFKSAFTEGAARLRERRLPATVFMNMAAVEGAPFWAGVVTYLCRYSSRFRAFIEARYGAPVTRDFFLRCTTQDVDAFMAGTDRSVVAEAAAYCGQFASGEELARSAADGLSLGNHLFNHYNAAALSLDALKEQYLRNHDAMASYPNRVSFFSYPFGQPVRCYNRATDALLTSLGALRLFTAFPLPNTVRGATRLHRITMFDHVDDEPCFRANCVMPALVNALVMKHRFAYV